MTTQSKILKQLKILETLYHQGNTNQTLEKTLEKIINQELTDLQQKKAELESDIQKFEQQYKIPSSEFYKRFHAGELGDDMDWVEWNAFYEMRNSLQTQIDLLQSSKIE